RRLRFRSAASRRTDRGVLDTAEDVRPERRIANTLLKGLAGTARRGLDRPMGASVFDVLPDDSSHLPVAGANLPQHVLYPSGLRPSLVAGCDLTDHHRLARSEPPNLPVGGLVDLVEAEPPRRAAPDTPIEAIDAGPIDIPVARVERTELGEFAVG